MDSVHNKHCVKSAQIQSFFWSDFSCIRTEYREIRARKNSVFGHFSHSEGKKDMLWKLLMSNKLFKISITHLVQKNFYFIVEGWLVFWKETLN